MKNKSKSFYWQKLGQILCPKKQVSWLYSHAGPSFAFRIAQSDLYDIYCTGRDAKNRSLIGRIRIDIRQPKKILEISPKPILTLGELGTFDENGLSYPYVVSYNQKRYVYYVGWMPTVLTPFNLQLGLAIGQKQLDKWIFQRYSRAPILPRNQDDYLSFGSCCVMKEEEKWRMWYTCFLKWGKHSGEHKHYYVIKYAESTNGLQWKRNNDICINIEHPSEYAICRPSVLKIDAQTYYMWYTYRGEQYRIGFATSNNGIDWKRQDEQAGIGISPKGWDDKAQCYPHVFRHKDKIYMLYNGNEYGRTGLGLAVLKGTLRF